MPRPSYSALFDHHSQIWQRVQIVKFLITPSVSESRGTTKHIENEELVSKYTGMSVGVSSLSFLRSIVISKQEHVTYSTSLYAGSNIQGSYETAELAQCIFFQKSLNPEEICCIYKSLFN